MKINASGTTAVAPKKQVRARKWAIAASFLFAVCLFGGESAGQQLDDGRFTILPPKELPPPVDLLEVDNGDITSRGNAAAAYVRPTDPLDLGRLAYFYPPFTESPLTPAQESLHLVENEPLTLLVPFGGSISGPFPYTFEGIHIDGFNIQADFHRHASSVVTATVYPPSERVYLLGPLPAGDYHLMLSTLVTDDWPGPNVVISTDGTVSVYESARYTGVINFTVHPVPEPSSLALLTLGLITCGALCRRSRALR